MDARDTSLKEFTSPRQEHEPIIDDENCCCLCGTSLKFQHKIDYLTLTIQDCPSCRIQMKSKEHTLQ